MGAFMRMIVKFCSLFAVASVLAATPALAMNWKIYAPDDNGTRYWLDTDSIVRCGDGYTYAYYQFGTPDGSAPTETSAPIIGIKCDTGDSVKLDNGQWVPGNHFTAAAFLFNALCPTSGK